MDNKSLVKIFKAIGNERRFLILRYLIANKELTVGQISGLIKLSFKSASRHLAVLLNAELVSVKQVNLNRFYAINDKNLKDFMKFFQK